ncbi:hypothetical protein M8494_23390 [Serratia ureilytica]
MVSWNHHRAIRACLAAGPALLRDGGPAGDFSRAAAELHLTHGAVQPRRAPARRRTGRGAIRAPQPARVP